MAAETAAKPDAAKSDGKGGVLGRLSELAWQALPAIASAIGFAGFVAIIGAAIELIRFHAAHLPAMQAVLAVPRQELVIVGALALAAFVLGGVLAVLLVYLIDNNGNATPNTARGLVAVGVLEMVVTLFFIGVHHVITYVLLGLWLTIIGLFAANLVASVMRAFTSRSKLKGARTEAIATNEKLAAAKAASAAAADVDQKHPSDATAAGRVSAESARVLAERDWERAIRKWRGLYQALIEELPEHARPSQPRDDQNDREAKLEKYAKDAPSVADLEATLDDAEGGTEHVFRSVGAHWRAQLVALNRKLQALIGPVVAFARRRLDKKRKPSSKTKDHPGEEKPQEDAARVLQDVEKARERASVRVVVWLLVAGVSALIIYGIVLVATEESFSWVAILLGVAALLAMMNLFVARATEKFAWYGVSVFFSVLLFGAALTIARTLDKPLVQPIALVRKSDNVGVCGVYITQTNDRVYVGRLPLKIKPSPGRPLEVRRPGLIFWVPTSDVDLVSVGQAERIGPRFPALAAALLRQLYKDRAEEPTTTLKNVTTTKVVNGAVKPTEAKGQQATTTSEEPPVRVPHQRHPHEGVGETCTSLPADP